MINNRIKKMQDETVSIINKRSNEIYDECKQTLLSGNRIDLIMEKGETKKELSEIITHINLQFKHLHYEIEKSVKEKFSHAIQEYISQSQNYLNEMSVQMERHLGIKADIAGHHALHEGLVEALIIGAVGQEAAHHHHAQEVGFRVVGHRALSILAAPAYTGAVGRGKAR